jgi:hypothetical protein
VAPDHIIAAIIFGLAFVGHIACLMRFFWVTLGLTAVVFAYFGAVIPIDAHTIPYWGVAILAPMVAITLASLLRAGRTEPKSISKSVGTQSTGRRMVLDGTNVMYWEDETARLDTLRAVVDYLMQREITPIVFLDASSRHHLKNTSLNERGFARALGVSQKQVMVCPAGTEADVFILKFAKQEDLPILSNDRFGDRAKLAKGIKIVKGVMAAGRPILDGL